MKRVLVAGVLGLALLLATPTLASSADRRGGDDNHHSDNRHSDDRGRDRGHYDGHDYGRRYGYYSPGYYDGYYGPGYDCYHDPSGYTTCEPYGGDYDPGGYNGGYPDPPPDPEYCAHRHSAHSAQCPEDEKAANNGVPPGMVVIRDLAFNPANINARVGEDVVWNFDDKGVAHTVTADNKSFDSGKRSSGEFTMRFPQPGVYSYHCSIHPDMKGQVTVGRES
jgi:plastocyanin